MANAERSCQWSAAIGADTLPQPHTNHSAASASVLFRIPPFHVSPLGWRATVQCSSILFGTVLRMQDLECLNPELRSPLPDQAPPWPTFAVTSLNIAAPSPPFQTSLHDVRSTTLGNVSTISGHHTHFHPLHLYGASGLIISSSFPLVMHDVPAESQEFLSNDDLPFPEGYYSPYSRRLSYDGRFQVDEDYSACVTPLDLHPPNSDSADPFENTLPSYQHQGTSEHPVKNSPELHRTTSTAAGSSDNLAPAHRAGVRLAPRRRRFRCETCQKSFDRPSRLENCRNRHSNSKPHECRGACGSSGWYVVCTIFLCSFRAFVISGLLIPQPSVAKYSSVEYLERHISPTNQCPPW